MSQAHDEGCTCRACDPDARIDAAERKPGPDPARARRLVLLGQVEATLCELFAWANGLPEPERTTARRFLHDLHARAAATPAASASSPRSTSAPMGGPRKAGPRLVVTPSANEDGSKGRKCARCDGSGRWRGRGGGSGSCFACHGTGVAQERTGGDR